MALRVERHGVRGGEEELRERFSISLRALRVWSNIGR
jgi:hypothetical protein